jgi:hypothetical protein
MITRSALFRSWTWHPCSLLTSAGVTPVRPAGPRWPGRSRRRAAEIPPLPGRAAARGGSRRGRHGEGGEPRWDGQNLHAFSGTYGDYLLGKVSKVFPQLRREVLTDEAP